MTDEFRMTTDGAPAVILSREEMEAKYGAQMDQDPVPEDGAAGARLTVQYLGRTIMDFTLGEAALTARVRDGELLPFVYREPIDPERPDTPRPLRRAVLAITDDKIVGPNL